MKNFKKVLALVLAVATVFTFAAMATAAEVKYDDFTDTAAINHVEAVQVLTGVGVINGFEDKTFKPAESVTRVQMAKMVGYIMNDGDDINDLYKAACPFADSKSNWGAGYIAYCATQGIVNGRDANTFDPNATVTGTEAAKMLLCALGYDAAIEGFTGADWATNVLTVAKKAGLLKELSQSKMGVALNREDAAQMIFNALKTAEVEYENKGTQITINGATIATGASSAKKVTGVHKGFDGDIDGVILWGEDHFIDEEDSAKQLTKGESTDAFNVKATVWYYGKDSDGAKVEISKDLKLAKKFVGSMTAADLYALVGKMTVTGAEKDQDTLKFSLDGIEIKAANLADYAANFKFGKQGNPAVNAEFADWADGDLLNNTTATQRGNSKFLADEIEVYVSDKDGEGRLIQVIGKTYSIGYVSKYTAAKLSSEDDKIEVTKTNGLAIANKEFVTTAFNKADVENETKVIYTYSVKEGKIQSVKKVDAVKSGAVTKISTDGDGNKVITADGKTYTFSKLCEDATKLNAEYDLFLDPNGKVLLAEETKSGSSNYYMVMKRANPIEGSGLDAADTVYQIRLLGADGKTVDLNVAEINGNDDVAANWKDDVLKPATPADEELDILTAETGTIVTYTLNNKGEAKLTTGSDDFKAETKEINANYEDLTNVATMLTAKKATSDTTFVLISLDKNDNYVFTPVSGIAAMKAVIGNYEYKNSVTVEVKSATNVATPDVAGVAFIFVDARNVTSTKTIFTALGKSDAKTEFLTGKTDHSVTYYEVNAVEGNETKKLKVEATEFDAKVGDKEFVLASSYTVDDDGFVTKITKAADSFVGGPADAGSKLSYSGNVLTIGDIEYTQDNVNVFLFNDDTDDVTGSKVAKNMTDEVSGKLYYYFNTNGSGTKTVVAIFAKEA